MRRVVSVPIIMSVVMIMVVPMVLSVSIVMPMPMPMPMPVPRAMSVSMVVVVSGATENPGTHQVDDQTEESHPQRLLVMDGRGEQ